MIGYLYITLALALAAYSNVAMKFCLNRVGAADMAGNSLLGFYLHFFFLTAWGWSCILSVFFCCVFWLLALARFELSYAIPFLSLNFVLVTVLSFVVLHEPFSWHRLIGVCIIVLGVFISSKGG